MPEFKEKSEITFGITIKLLITFLCVALIPMAAYSFISYLNAVRTLRTQSVEHIITIADMKSAAIENYLMTSEEEIVELAHNPLVIRYIIQTGKGDRKSVQNSHEDYMQGDIIMSYLYYCTQTYGMHDIFLINSQGDLLLTVAKEVDYGTNLLTGPYKNTQLAKTFKDAITLSEANISPFEYYPPSNAIAAFMGVPIWYKGNVVGAVCLQIDIGEINSFAEDYEGLGVTGETVIAVQKEDYVEILSQLRYDSGVEFSNQNIFGLQKAQPIQLAVQAREGTGEMIDYRDKNVIAVWRYLYYAGWGLVVKMDTNEIFAPAHGHRNWSIFIGVVTLLFVVLVSIFVSRSITNPIIKLTHSAKIIASSRSGYNKIDVLSHDEIGILTESFNTMAENLQKRTDELISSNKELDDFAYTASHDLKEPLRGIHNYSSFLIEDYEDKLDDDGRHKLLTLMKLSKYLEALINDLLYYSRVGRTQENIREIDLNLIVSELIESLRIRVEEEGIDIRIPASLPTVYCDKSRIKAIFSNLITNSIKYNDKEEKWIEIGYTEDEYSDDMAFYVRDNGIGIEEEYTETIFMFFQRLHERDEYGGGTGAGLAIVKKMVEFHGGEIRVESTPGEGTTFCFTLGREDHGT